MDQPLHFTNADRDTLTTLRVNLDNLREDIREILTRLARLEENRVSVRDLEETYTEIDDVRQAIKACKEELLTVLQGQRNDINMLLYWRWYVLGIATAIGAIVGAVIALLSRLLWSAHVR